ncbi:MAG TPA: hypothetical protein PKU83_07695 [Chryseolinea sp.]|nr:hypothetical protein [Chryseolinea sp.]
MSFYLRMEEHCSGLLTTSAQDVFSIFFSYTILLSVSWSKKF